MLPAFLAAKFHIFLFYEMSRRYYRRRVRNYVRSNYSVQRRVLALSAWTQNPNDRESYASSVTLISAPSDAGNDVLQGGPKTVKHIEVQLLQRPTATLTSTNQIRRAYPGCIWMAVYVPEGTQPNIPFNGGTISQIALYEPAQFVLGSGVIPYAGEKIEASASTNYDQDLSQYMSAGNATRIRVPLSKKLNPGDRIEFIVATLNSDYGTEPAPVWGECKLLVKYAMKYN